MDKKAYHIRDAGNDQCAACAGYVADIIKAYQDFEGTVRRLARSGGMPVGLAYCAVFGRLAGSALFALIG